MNLKQKCSEVDEHLYTPVGTEKVSDRVGRQQSHDSGGFQA